MALSPPNVNWPQNIAKTSLKEQKLIAANCIENLWVKFWYSITRLMLCRFCIHAFRMSTIFVPIAAYVYIFIASDQEVISNVSKTTRHVMEVLTSFHVLVQCMTFLSLCVMYEYVINQCFHCCQIWRQCTPFFTRYEFN